LPDALFQLFGFEACFFEKDKGGALNAVFPVHSNIHEVLLDNINPCKNELVAALEF